MLSSPCQQIGYVQLAGPIVQVTFIQFPGLGFKDDVDFAMYMTTEVGVACIPPSAFYQDPAHGANLCRWCFAKTDATLEAAEQRLMAWAGRKA